MRLFLLVPTILILLLPGCGKKADLGRAEQAVRASLEVWKGGGKPNQLGEKAIDIVEPDWLAGYKLVDFQVKNASTQPQQGPRVVVVLSLQGRGGKAVSREVAYEVVFKDQNKVSIGRDPFHIGS